MTEKTTTNLSVLVLDKSSLLLRESFEFDFTPTSDT